MVNRDEKLKKLIISAVMVALGTILSLFKFEGLWAFGGGVTFCAMLPLVVTSYIFGCKWGAFTAFGFSILQLVLGIDNIQYASSFVMAVLISLFDYIGAYTVIGFSGMFKDKMKNQNLAIVLGIFVTFSARFLFHFVIGWMIWDALWPNEFGLVSPIYSFLYNGSYMLPETVLTSAVAVITFNISEKLLKKYDFKRHI